MCNGENERLWKEQYQKLNAYIVPDETLIRSVIRKAKKQQSRQNRRGAYVWKYAAAFASVSICLYLAMPALASSTDYIYQMMYRVSPEIAQYFMPVQKEDVDHGIKMEVLSAYIHDHTAEIYITLQDLEGDRIDATTDLFDSYQINRPFDSTCHCEPVGYDKRTKTATFLITIDQWGNQDISGDKITFSLRTFISGYKTFENIFIPIKIVDKCNSTRTQTVSCIGASSADETWFAKLGGDMTALIPAAPMREFSIDGITLTGIGYIDGKLHIQTAFSNPLENDNHGYFWLQDEKGRKVESIYSFSFTETSKQNERTDYKEEVFEITPQELEDYGLYGTFVTTGKKTDGTWRVTFPLEKNSR